MSDAQAAAVYYWFRLIVGFVSVVLYAELLRRAIPMARRQQTARMRRFLSTLVVLLAHWTVVLFVSAAYNVLVPPSALPTPISLALGTYLGVAVAVGGWLLLRYLPRDPV